MKYSVWNNKRKTYSVYEHTDPPVYSLSREKNLGSSPEDVMPSLPPGSRYLGESEIAEGIVVKSTMSVWQILIFVAAGVAARYVYDRFLS